jgi:hypothetical protein
VVVEVPDAERLTRRPRGYSPETLGPGGSVSQLKLAIPLPYPAQMRPSRRSLLIPDT